MNKKDLQDRLRRIEGQVRGLQRMVDEDKYCIDILTQVSSVQAALRAVGMGLLDDHVRHCVRESLEHGEGDQKIEELMLAVGGSRGSDGHPDGHRAARRRPRHRGHDVRVLRAEGREGAGRRGRRGGGGREPGDAIGDGAYLGQRSRAVDERGRACRLRRAPTRGGGDAGPRRGATAHATARGRRDRHGSHRDPHAHGSP